jgi:hypothetical protein
LLLSAPLGADTALGVVVALILSCSPLLEPSSAGSAGGAGEWGALSSASLQAGLLRHGLSCPRPGL